MNHRSNNAAGLTKGEYIMEDVTESDAQREFDALMAKVDAIILNAAQNEDAIVAVANRVFGLAPNVGEGADNETPPCGSVWELHARLDTALRILASTRDEISRLDNL